MHSSTRSCGRRLAELRRTVVAIVALVSAPLVLDLSLNDYFVGAFIAPESLIPLATINRSSSINRGDSKGSSSTTPIMSTESSAVERAPSLPTTVKGILFDMDGTLTDSDTLHFEAYRETFLKVTPQFNGGEPITREYYDDWMSGNSNPAIVEKLFPDMAFEDQTALWKSKEVVYRLKSTEMTPLPGLLDFLDRCTGAGLAMIIVTNAPRLDAVHTLKVLDLFDRFGETMIIGYECTRAKPYPDPYLEGLSKLGLPADACVAFEDSVNGVSSAVSAGLYTIGVGAGSSEKLRDVIGGGLCVTDYLDSQLCETLGLGKSSDSDR